MWEPFCRGSAHMRGKFLVNRNWLTMLQLILLWCHGLVSIGAETAKVESPPEVYSRIRQL